GLLIGVPTPHGTRRCAVLGRPISHSLSPILHRAAYSALGLDWTFDAVDCGVEDLPAALEQRPDWAGFSCTMPLKHAVLDVAHEVRPIARAIGAANTLLPGAEGWIADNTDVAGIVAAMAEHALAPATATILGAGGTAQAALGALLTLGIQDCTVLVRDLARTDALRATADRLGIGVVLGPLEPHSAALGADLVMSTLPPGAADALADRPWSPIQAILDVVYASWPTPLARAAAAGGAHVVSGALILLHQAAVQVALMTGQDAPVADMRVALAAAAPGCGV
ncbi:MAG TPA: shikimate dehydrogenase, partial [Jatrophihabitans sp.]|nr:shikimate dehydrogenase [Jatrophihabitans sp.]